MMKRGNLRVMFTQLLRPNRPERRTYAVRCSSNTAVAFSEVHKLALKLSPSERDRLLHDLQEQHAKEVMDSYEGRLAKIKWRSKFGRPSKMSITLTSDPTGQFCEVPPDWLQERLVAKTPAPTRRELRQVMVHNSIPFIGFGFLDNLIMILAGDYIDVTIGAAFGISTMAAAALGNTVSDVAGIGSAWYVENIATKVGMTPPALTPLQLEMRSSRLCANFGRALGLVIGCLLGMFPLLFIHAKENEAGSKSGARSAKTTNDAKVDGPV